MTDGLILDTSVFVAATRKEEFGHVQARDLLDRCIGSGVDLVEPAHFVAEFLGALVRTGSTRNQARRLLAVYRKQGRMNLQPITVELADAAGDIAATSRIKGCDAIYLALADLLSIPLVTLDREQWERASSDIEVFTPEQALEKL